MKRPFLIFAAALLCPIPAAHASAATDLLTGGDYARAYEAALSTKDFLTAAEAALAYGLYRSSGDRAWIERAIGAARAAVKDEPGNPKAHRLLGGALGLKADISGTTLTAFALSREIRSVLEKSLALSPGYAEGRVALARWHAGAYAKAGRISGGNPDTARKLTQQALSAAPQNIFVQTQAALVYRDVKDVAAARSTLQRALSLPAQGAQDRDAQGQARTLLGTLGAP